MTTAATRPVESPFFDREMPAAPSGVEAGPGAAALAAGSPFVHAVEHGRLFEALVPAVAQADLRRRLDEYLALAEAEYTIPAHTPPGGAAVAASTARARPQFRYARGDSEQVKAAAISTVSRLTAGALGAAHRNAIGNAVYGRAKPDEIAGITQALIDRGQLDAVRAAHPGGSDAFLVRALQRRFRIGIDCAGYVQLAFLFAFTGSDEDPPARRAALGLHPRRTWEALRNLPAAHFTRVPVVDARTGDLFVLRPQATSADQAWHTVIVASRTLAGTVHTFEVHASWGVDMFGVRAGGVGARIWRHDTSNGEWWDIAPNDRTVCGQTVTTGDRTCVNTVGPYAGHRPHGMYRPRET